MKIILFVATTELTPASRLALALARELKTQWHEVTLVGLVKSKDTAPAGPLGADATSHGIEYRVLQQRLKIDPGVIGQAEVMFSRLQADLFISFDFVGVTLYRIGRYRPDNWLAFHLPDTWTDRKPTGLRDRLARRVERKALHKAVKVALASGAEAEPWLRENLQPEQLLALPSACGDIGDEYELPDALDTKTLLDGITPSQ